MIARGKLVSVLVIAATIAFAACGIETFVYLYPVTYRDFEPSAVATNNYFSFRTSDEKNETESSGYFRGFEIYYRIYNDKNALVSEKSEINNYNENNPTTAYDYLLNTKKYQRLSCSVRPTDIPLIPGADENRGVIVRLVQFNDQAPQISVDGNSSLYGTPLRTNNGTLNTDKLFDLDEIDAGDSDFSYNSTWDTTTAGKKLAYVEAYVVANGYDESFKSLYSKLFELGYITLTED